MDEDFLPRLHSDCWSRHLFRMEERLALKTLDIIWIMDNY